MRRAVLAGSLMFAACRAFDAAPAPAAASAEDGGSGDVRPAVVVPDASTRTPFCELPENQGAYFCDDFNRPDRPGRWKPSPARPDTARVIVEGGAPAGGEGNALHVTLTNVTKSLSGADAALDHDIDRTLTANAKRIELSYRVAIARESFAFVKLGGIVYARAEKYQTHSLQLFGHNEFALDGDDTKLVGDRAAPALATWYRVGVVLTKGDSGSLFDRVVSVDGAVVSKTGANEVQNALITVRIGPWDTSADDDSNAEPASTDLDVWYDDVVVKVE